jgi:predicted PurR-regulated permease PerM
LGYILDFPFSETGNEQGKSMTQHQMFVLAFFVVLLVLCYQIAIIFAPFLVPVLWAVIIARMSNSLYLKLVHLLRGRDTLAASLLTFATMFLVVFPIVSLTFLLVQETAIAYRSVVEWVQAGGMKQLPEYLGKIPLGGRFIQEQLGTFVMEGSGYEGSIVEGTKTVGAFLFAQMSDLARNTFSLTIDFSIMLFTLFFFYKDGRDLFWRLYHLLPLEERHKQKVFDRLDSTMAAVVKGVLASALVQGVLAGGAYVFLGAPFPLVLATITALFSLLPLGGTALVWVPVAGYLFWSGPVWKGIAMAAWGGLVVVGLIDNFFKPLFIGHGTQLPTLFLFFSIIGGLAAYGFIGVFFGPILLAILLTAIHIYEEEYQTIGLGIPKTGTDT